MNVHVLSNKSKNKPSIGDIKTDKTGIYIRVHRKTRGGSFVMMRGKPIYDWECISKIAPEGFKGRAVIEYKN